MEDLRELLEFLAERSHINWMKEQQTQGYADHAWKVCRGNACPLPIMTKHHPDMLPYSELAENVKEYDRQTVLGVLDGIRDAGYVILKPAVVEIETHV